jgi:hypothetical protein
LGSPPWSWSCCCPVEEAFPTTPMGYAPIPNRKGAVKARPIERGCSPFQILVVKANLAQLCGQGFECERGVPRDPNAGGGILTQSPSGASPSFCATSLQMHVKKHRPTVWDRGPINPGRRAQRFTSSRLSESQPELQPKLPRSHTPHVRGSGLIPVLQNPLQEASPDPSRCPEARRVCVGPRHPSAPKERMRGHGGEAGEPEDLPHICWG